MEGLNSQNICFGLFLIYQLLITCTGFETYFPLSGVHLTIPKNNEALKILQNNSLAKFNVETLHSSFNSQENLENNFQWEIYSESNFLSINETTGKLWINEKRTSELRNITSFIISANKNKSLNVRARMSITLIPIEVYDLNSFCGKAENLCFWNRAIYEVPENILAQKIIGDLGPFSYKTLCPQWSIKYILLNGTTLFGIRNGTLTTVTRLDHDTFNPGPMATIKIQCQLKHEQINSIQIVEKIIQIAILDKNDNPPQLQTNEPLTIHVDDPHFRKDTEVSTKSIMFSDNDSLNVNSRIVYEIVNDTFEILKPECKAYEADHEGLKASAINCKIIYARSGILRQSPYCVELKASDPTVEIANNKVYKTVSANICLHADLNKIHDLDKPAAQALQAGFESKKRNRKNRKFIYSSDESSLSDTSDLSSVKLPPVKYPRDASVFRYAENMSRVTEPINLTELLHNKIPTFKILEDRTNAFGITPVGGIVYVKNTTALLNAEEMLYYLFISWQKESTNIIIHLEDHFPNQFCSENNSKMGIPCSEIGSKKDCIKTCGIGSNGGSCQWRSNNSTGNLTINYSTCSANLTTCPNGVCDPLEELGQHLALFICPQDCTASTNIFGPHTVNEGGRGIRAASGLCTCDEFSKCSCGPHELSVPRTRKHKKSDLTPLKIMISKNDESNSVVQNVARSCGLNCQISIVICSIVLSTIIIISILLYRRKYRKKTIKGISDKNKENELENFIDVPLVPITSEFTFKNDFDSKWEFPRSQLVLDITLGEGEFGKVVKGYATNIQNKPGVTTVAVKMLKSTANSVELLALLSEFQLLQEVAHPNVIQLLGACTQESPMIIIEYAMHGSLRNYLRLSRKLECHGLEFSNGIEPVTVKDILSFAWQICKGMAYLTEIKLVHRDLAARNVLLTETKVCKVSDFGLTRDVYEDDAYLKQSKDRVPVKWMAPESLADHIYTTRSDVWAFGVLAWELITLGASPYPGVPPQNLYHLLKTGYRMERPENCSEEIYLLIKSCWADDPFNRPSFKFLASQWEKLLGNNTKYLELDGNAVSNPLYCSNGTDDNESENRKMSTDSCSDFEEPDRIDHLWKPPYTTANTVKNEQSKGNVNGTVLLGYDIPRPLIEAKTVEQHLKYQNDLAMPMNVKDLELRNLNLFVDIPHYASPIKRRKSYMDMTGGSSNGYNFDEKNNFDKKKLSKDITFRFSSLLNLSD